MYEITLEKYNFSRISIKLHSKSNFSEKNFHNFKSFIKNTKNTRVNKVYLQLKE